MVNKLTSRKFISAILIIIINALLVYFTKISDGVYSTVMVATIASYLAANVIQKKEATEIK